MESGHVSAKMGQKSEYLQESELFITDYWSVGRLEMLILNSNFSLVLATLGVVSLFLLHRHQQQQDVEGQSGGGAQWWMCKHKSRQGGLEYS